LKKKAERSFETSRSTTTGQGEPQISHSVCNTTTTPVTGVEGNDCYLL